MSTTPAEILSVTLYMKAGCHLCEEAEATLESLQPRYAHRLERIDITTDPELGQRYGELIPVLVVAGIEYPAPLGRTAIEQSLAHATDAASHSGESSTTQAQHVPNSETPPKARRFPWSKPRGR